MKINNTFAVAIEQNYRHSRLVPRLKLIGFEDRILFCSYFVTLRLLALRNAEERRWDEKWVQIFGFKIWKKDTGR
jgi:hypothetical protein